jgi:anti-anti-sigma regulatory factor
MGNRKAKEIRLRIEGDLTLPRAGEVRSLLMEAFEKADHISLDLGAVAEADAAGLQLLCAAHRSAVGKGKVLECPERSPQLAQAIDAAGLWRHKGCTDSCLWRELRDGVQAGD